jgi:hypothetical protein
MGLGSSREEKARKAYQERDTEKSSLLHENSEENSAEKHLKYTICSVYTTYISLELESISKVLSMED